MNNRYFLVLTFGMAAVIFLLGVLAGLCMDLAEERKTKHLNTENNQPGLQAGEVTGHE